MRKHVLTLVILLACIVGFALLALISAGGKPAEPITYQKAVSSVTTPGYCSLSAIAISLLVTGLLRRRVNSRAEAVEAKRRE